MHRFRLFLVVLIGVTVGCDIPYKKEYDAAMDAKKKAEKIAAEATKSAEFAKKALTEEQNATRRLFNED